MKKTLEPKPIVLSNILKESLKLIFFLVGSFNNLCMKTFL
jgi:hypothetical protein